jgi:DNA-binding CsgD family transcriptional regulator
VVTEAGPQHARLFDALQRLLALETVDLETALNEAAQTVADVLAADKADVFLHDPGSASLVALGTSATPMGRRQRELGLDRLPIADGGGTVHVFQTGRSHLCRDAQHEQGERCELPALVELLGVRSQVGVPLDVRGEQVGVLMACSTTPAFFSETDLVFLETIARWVGLVGYRIAALEQTVAEAARAGFRAAAEETVGRLTPRQREVARLIADGLSNAEIAQQLVLTPGTVANHVEHILRRLGFRSRAQVAALLGGSRGFGQHRA